MTTTSTTSVSITTSTSSYAEQNRANLKQMTNIPNDFAISLLHVNLQELTCKKSELLTSVRYLSNKESITHLCGLKGKLLFIQAKLQELIHHFNKGSEAHSEEGSREFELSPREIYMMKDPVPDLVKEFIEELKLIQETNVEKGLHLQDDIKRLLQEIQDQYKAALVMLEESSTAHSRHTLIGIAEFILTKFTGIHEKTANISGIIEVIEKKVREIALASEMDQCLLKKKNAEEIATIDTRIETIKTELLRLYEQEKGSSN